MAVSPTRRAARISFGEKGDTRAVHVSYPGRLTGAELGRIQKVLVEDVIKGLTGCSCLSGIIPVIFEPDFAKSIEVNLGQ